MRFRSADHIRAEHVGRRVTIRRRIEGGGTGDVIGILRSVGPDDLRVLRADGTDVHILRGDVVAARLITE